VLVVSLAKGAASRTKASAKMELKQPMLALKAPVPKRGKTAQKKMRRYLNNKGEAV
jgi:hypothetical protein